MVVQLIICLKQIFNSIISIILNAKRADIHYVVKASLRVLIGLLIKLNVSVVNVMVKSVADSNVMRLE